MEKENKRKELLIAIYKRRVIFLKICCALFVVLAVYFLFIADYSQAPKEAEEEGSEAVGDISSGDDALPNGKSVSSRALSLDDEIARIIEEEEQNHLSPIEEDEEEKKPETPAVESKKSERIFPAGEKNYITVVIDDMSINHILSQQIIAEPKQLTLSFLTYGEHFKEQVEEAKAAGHEVIVHIPMEPYAAPNTAPEQLNVSMKKEEIRNILVPMLDNFENLEGGNNHMGSKFTENKEKMSVVMEVLKERNMFFLDSKTSAKAIGCEVAEKYGVECLDRDVFLDNENDFEYITNQLKQLEKAAKKKGYAIAIGHPKTETVKALKKWLKNLNSDEFELIKLKDLLKKIKNMKKNS